VCAVGVIKTKKKWGGVVGFYRLRRWFYGVGKKIYPPTQKNPKNTMGEVTILTTTRHPLMFLHRDLPFFQVLKKAKKVGGGATTGKTGGQVWLYTAPPFPEKEIFGVRPGEGKDLGTFAKNSEDCMEPPTQRWGCQCC